MKIELEKWIIDGSVAYKIANLEKCCDDIINSENIDYFYIFDIFYLNRSDFLL